MTLSLTAFHVPLELPGAGNKPVFGYGSAWSRWLRDAGETALVLVADAPPLTEATMCVQCVPGLPLALLGDERWPFALAVPLDAGTELNDSDSVQVCLVSESAPSESLTLTIRQVSPMLRREMLGVHDEMPLANRLDYVNARLAERTDILIRQGELTHADARLMAAENEADMPFHAVRLCRRGAQ